MTNPLKVALTKRALESQLMRAGTPRREAEQISARLPHPLQWRKLPLRVQGDIAWKCLMRKEPDHG